jgi:two-component system OmpR family response regulator
MDPPSSDLLERGAQILAWPAETRRREELRADGVPRLLMLEAGTPPPPVEDDLEDWIWLPADEQNVFARLRHLAARQPHPGLDRTAVQVFDDGLAWIAGRRLHLPPAEAAILRHLSDPPERLCTREELERVAWGGVPHQRRSLDSRIFVLRRRVAPHGLTINAVRGRGFVLTRAQDG